jgi:hypothetical protein
VYSNESTTPSKAPLNLDTLSAQVLGSPLLYSRGANRVCLTLTQLKGTTVLMESQQELIELSDEQSGASGKVDSLCTAVNSKQDSVAIHLEKALKACNEEVAVIQDTKCELLCKTKVFITGSALGASLGLVVGLVVGASL